MRHYTNLEQMESKIRLLLSTFSFGRVRDVLAIHGTR